jgi:phosphohistidine phosphatase
MRIILFRHGPAGERDASRWPDDGARPLTARGVDRTHAAARGLAQLEPGIRRIVASPLQRAAMTAEILAEVFDEATREPLEALGPGGSYRGILEFVRGLPEDDPVVLVGHEPDLGKLAGILAFGAPAALPLKKAGACAFDFEGSPAPGTGRLLWLLTPRVLRRMAKEKLHA